MSQADLNRLARGGRRSLWWRVRRLLLDNPDVWFTADIVAEQVGCTANYASKILRILWLQRPDVFTRKQGSYQRKLYKFSARETPDE